MQCSVCAKPEADVTGKLLLCSKCKATAYCCKKCQRSDAKSHKKVCGLLNKGIGSTDAVAQASAFRFVLCFRFLIGCFLVLENWLCGFLICVLLNCLPNKQ